MAPSCRSVTLRRAFQRDRGNQTDTEFAIPSASRQKAYKRNAWHLLAEVSLSEERFKEMEWKPWNFLNLPIDYKTLDIFSIYEEQSSLRAVDKQVEQREDRRLPLSQRCNTASIVYKDKIEDVIQCRAQLSLFHAESTFKGYNKFLLETEQDMYLTEQELDQWIQRKDKEAEEEIKLILQKRSAKTMSAIPLNSVEVKDEEYWSDHEESEGELDVYHPPSHSVVHLFSFLSEHNNDHEVVDRSPEVWTVARSDAEGYCTDGLFDSQVKRSALLNPGRKNIQNRVFICGIQIAGEFVSKYTPTIGQLGSSIAMCQFINGPACHQLTFQLIRARHDAENVYTGWEESTHGAKRLEELIGCVICCCYTCFLPILNWKLRSVVWVLGGWEGILIPAAFDLFGERAMLVNIVWE
ncbi:hypothetical protein Sjap_008245 [Stephania japonica]|uniref:Uncharacterized protein n=1 Tax=Stephania japonica TaxID=461633 RepID=A0AAP0PEA2_9MAGN